MGNVCYSNAVRDVYVPSSPTPICKNIDIVCESTGSYGCFVFNVNGVLEQFKESLWENFSVSKIVSISSEKTLIKQPLTNKDKEILWKFIMKDDICMKVFYRETDNKHVMDEMQSFNILSKEIFPNQIEKYTTYAPCPDLDNAVAFNLELPTYATFYIKDPKYTKIKNPIQKNGIYILLHRQCQSSLYENIYSKPSLWKVDPDVFMWCILSTICSIHTKKYAHLDIKLENIVYCPNDTEFPYKLIDYNLVNLKENLFYENKGYIRTQLYTHPILMYFNLINDYSLKNLINEYSLKNLIHNYRTLYEPKEYEDMRGVYNDVIDRTNEVKSINTLLNKPNFLYYKSDEYAIAMVMVEVFGYKTVQEFFKPIYDQLTSYENSLSDWCKPTVGGKRRRILK